MLVPDVLTSVAVILKRNQKIMSRLVIFDLAFRVST